MNRDLILVSLSLITWGIGEGMFYYFQPLYLEQLGAEPILIGSILGVVGIAMAISYLPAGILADRVGRRPLIYAAWVIGTIATWIMALSENLPLFTMGIVLYGFTSFVMVPLNSYITAARGRWSVGRAITLISASFNIGAILGPLIGGWIGDQVGLHRTFMVAGSLFVISTTIIFFIRPQPVEGTMFEPGMASLKKMLNGRFVQFLVVIFIAMFVMFFPQPLSQNFLQNHRGLSLTEIGQLVAARGLGVVLLNLGLGQINARIGFMLAQFAMGLYALLIWKGLGLPWYLAGYLLLGSFQTARSLAIAQGRALISSANMGIAYGMIESMSALALILAPPLAGIIYTYNPVMVYQIGLVLIILALFSTVFLIPLHAREVV